MRSLILVLALAAACGGSKPPPPAKPKLPTPKELATLLDEDMRQLAAITESERGHCEELIAAMRPLVGRMQDHLDQSHTYQMDPKLGVELKAEVKAFDERARGRTDRIAGDLAATYLSCAPPCAKHRDPNGGLCQPSKEQQELRHLIDQIPNA